PSRPGRASDGREVRPISLCRSAKRAVDGDLLQGALENGQLLIIEAGYEMPRDSADVGRHGLGEPSLAHVGERNDNAPPVGTGVRSADQAIIDEPGDAAGHARP